MTTKEYFVTNNRFKYIGLLLIIMFLVLMIFLFLKADEITKDPCSICAKQMGENVFCYVGNLARTYYPNYSIFNNAVG